MLIKQTLQFFCNHDSFRMIKILISENWMKKEENHEKSLKSIKFADFLTATRMLLKIFDVNDIL